MPSQVSLELALERVNVLSSRLREHAQHLASAASDTVTLLEGLDAEEAAAVATQYASDGSRLGAASALSDAELRVLRLLPQPLSHEQISARLGTSVGASRTRAVTVYRVLGVASRGDAVRRARELGLV